MTDQVNKRKEKSNLRRALFLLLLATSLIAGCATDAAETAVPESSISVQLSWFGTIEFAGFYAAIEHGYYAQENLDVQLLEGGFDDSGAYIDPVEKVLAGEADFGIFNADSLILARAAGNPVVALAAIYQRNPTVLFSLAEENIRTPQDLVGKRIGVSFGSDDIVFTALLHSQGVAASEVTMVPADPSLNALLAGEVDAQMGFVTNEPVLLRQQGYEVNLILPSDYGIDLYSNLIFTSEDLVEKDPDLVTRFLQATLHGYEEAMDDPDHAAQLSVQRNPELDLDGELASMQASLPLLRPAGSPPGMMTVESWQAAYQFMLDQGLLDQPIDIGEVYDLSFLNEIYSQ